MKVNLTSCLIIILFISTSNFAIAQKKITKGYIISQQSDTIRGFINDRNWNKNPEKIEFKRQESDVFQDYSSSMIKAFYIEPEEYYESKIVSIDKTVFDLSLSGAASNRVLIVDTIFLTVCVKGKASLFHFKDKEDKNHFYISKEDGPLEELIMRKYKKQVDGVMMVGVEEKYKTQLYAHLNDCSTLKETFAKAQFTRKSLQDLFIKYNQCGKSSSQYVSKHELIKFKVGALAGLSFVRLDFKGNYNDQLVKPTFKTSTSFTAGVSLDAVLPRNKRRWSLYNELRLKTYKTDATYRDENNTLAVMTYTSSFDVAYISLVNMVRYRLTSNKVRPFINIGIANSIVIKDDNTEVLETQFYSSTRTSSKEALAFRKHEQCIVFGIGAEWKRLGGEIRYEIGNGMSSATSLSSSTKTLSFLLNFSLN